MYFCKINFYRIHLEMEHQHLEGLNPSQYEAVVNFNNPCIIIAGAGSGKTRVLTSRVAHLLSMGVPAYTILALTFTNKAAKEMRERIAKLVNPDKATQLWMGTFHSIFSRILRFEADKIGFTKNYTIYDTQDSANLIKSIVKEMELNPKEYKHGYIHSKISKAKNNLITPAIYANNIENIDFDKRNRIGEFYLVYQKYFERCKTSDAMDFDDLLLYMNILIRDNADILNKYQSRFNYILVDEYQDTNFSQYRIIKNLCIKHKNICVVGDDAQSIYSFRGARLENIFNFQSDFPEHQIYKLEQNYRSTQTIVNAANSVIAHNQRQLKKTIFSKNEIGTPIRLISAITEVDEGFKVVNELCQTIDPKNPVYHNKAILYRNNAQSRIIEEALRKRTIPYQIYGGITFYQRKEIKDCLAYFRVAVNHRDDQSLLRILNYPLRGIGDTTIEKIESAALRFNVPLWTIIASDAIKKIDLKPNAIEKISKFIKLIQSFTEKEQSLDAYDCAVHIIRYSGIYDDLNGDKSVEGQSRFMNVEELINGVSDFVATEHNKDSGVVRLSQFLENVSLLTDFDIKDNNPNKVSLMTVHSSKGLEFDYVYIIGMEENMFPSYLSSSEQEIEEERRLFYVALTRAKKYATLSWTRQRTIHGSFESQQLSRFVDEIDSQYLSEDRRFGESSMHSPNFKQFNFQRNTNPQNRNYFDSPTPDRPTDASTFSLNSPKIEGYNFKSPLSISKKPVNSSSENQTDNNSDNYVEYKTLEPGQEVVHQKFGKGKVIRLEGDGNNTKAVIEFQSGSKALLLKYAKFLKQS